MGEEWRIQNVNPQQVEYAIVHHSSGEQFRMFCETQSNRNSSMGASKEGDLRWRSVSFAYQVTQNRREIKSTALVITYSVYAFVLEYFSADSMASFILLGHQDHNASAVLYE